MCAGIVRENGRASHAPRSPCRPIARPRHPAVRPKGSASLAMSVEIAAHGRRDHGPRRRQYAAAPLRHKQRLADLRFSNCCILVVTADGERPTRSRLGRARRVSAKARNVRSRWGSKSMLRFYRIYNAEQSDFIVILKPARSAGHQWEAAMPILNLSITTKPDAARSQSSLSA